jgi:RNA recognition motif-containing protein
MTDDAEGQKAIDELNDTEFEGKTIVVNVARPRTERNSGPQNNRGGSGYNKRRY